MLIVVITKCQLQVLLKQYYCHYHFYTIAGRHSSFPAAVNFEEFNSPFDDMRSLLRTNTCQQTFYCQIENNNQIAKSCMDNFIRLPKVNKNVNFKQFGNVSICCHVLICHITDS